MGEFFVIRIGKMEDQKAVRGLAEALSTSYQVNDADFNRAWGELLKDPQARVLVAEEGGAVIGYLLGFIHRVFYANGPVGFIEEVMVAEGFRMRGIGRELMNEFESLAKLSGCPQVALATRRVGEFYKAVGYTESATYFKKKL